MRLPLTCDVSDDHSSVLTISSSPCRIIWFSVSARLSSHFASSPSWLSSPPPLFDFLALSWQLLIVSIEAIWKGLHSWTFRVATRAVERRWKLLVATIKLPSNMYNDAATIIPQVADSQVVSGLSCQIANCVKQSEFVATKLLSPIISYNNLKRCSRSLASGSDREPCTAYSVEIIYTVYPV